MELVSESFARLPDDVLLPWLPELLLLLDGTGDEVVPELVQEAGRLFPDSLEALDDRTPEWEREAAGSSEREGAAADLSAAERAVNDFLREQRAAADAVADCLGVEGGWTSGSSGGVHASRLEDDECARAARQLLFDHRETAASVGSSFGLGSDEWVWDVGGQKPADEEDSVGDLLAEHDETLRALTE